MLHEFELSDKVRSSLALREQYAKVKLKNDDHDCRSKKCAPQIKLLPHVP